MSENELSKVIVDSAIEVHRELGGPGLLEEVYEEALEEELRLRGLMVERQVPVRIVYKGRGLRKALRLDMRIEKLVLIDNKAVTDWNPIFEAQMLTYLRLTRLKLGLVINFGERVVSAGIHRVVNGLEECFDFNAKPQRPKAARVTNVTKTLQSPAEAK
jgi:GxxExxY protein